MSSRFEWDEDNVGHLARHGVTPAEFEQVFDNGYTMTDYDVIGGEERWTAPALPTRFASWS